MPGPARAGFSVADVLRDHAPRLAFRDAEHHALLHILACRTGQLGGHLDVCDAGCGERRFVYHSCRDRHCPRCGGLDQALWAEAQATHLLPVPYFHLVPTVPASLRPFFFSPERARTLDALFAAASETILDLARDMLGIVPSVLAVLHTWNQRLDRHPHGHFLVSAGGLRVDGGGWRHRSKYFLPIKQVRFVFRGKLLQRLDELHRARLSGLACDSGHQLLEDARKRTWQVYLKRTLAGPEQAIRYFARYTRRIAISESRLVSYDGTNVTFRARNPRHGNRSEPYTIDGVTFTRRFLSHVLPPGFVRIRRYGILGNRGRKRMLAQSRAALDAPTPPTVEPETRVAACLRIFGVDPSLCPGCGKGRMVPAVEWGPQSFALWKVIAAVLARAP